MTGTSNTDPITVHIYVKADGRTVCEPTDPGVAELKYARGSVLSEAQRNALIFPGAPVSAEVEPVPDAGQRRNAELPDTQARRPRRGK